MIPDAAQKAAESVGSSSVSVQVWFLFIVLVSTSFYLIQSLRQELKEQSDKREKLLNNLTEIVTKNNELFERNIKVLENNDYTVRRCQETLDKFS